jgi:hypothetical protein
VIGGEAYLNSAAEALRVNLPAALRAIDSEISIPLDDGGAVGARGTDYYVGVVKKPIRYPLIEVAVPDWKLDAFDLNRLTANASFPVFVGATMRSADLSTDRLYRMQMRYTAAILNVLLNPDKWAVSGAITAVQGAYRQSPAERADAEEITGSIVVAFAIETTDQRVI